uniref:Uncharacterized protein n=1 Tax=Arundo donax TaxID=35708 RepID=A0A0A9F661_ARUDO
MSATIYNALSCKPAPPSCSTRPGGSIFMVHRDHRCLPHGCLFSAAASSIFFAKGDGRSQAVGGGQPWMVRVACCAGSYTEGERDGKSSGTHYMASIPQLLGLTTWETLDGMVSPLTILLETIFYSLC